MQYEGGKSHADLKQVADRFSQWAAKTMRPIPHGYSPANLAWAELPEVIWLGSWPSGTALVGLLPGRQGRELAQAFDAVVDCIGHVLASSVQISVPDGPPGDGVMFSQCSFADGGDYAKAAAAHKAFSGRCVPWGQKGFSN